MLKTILLAMTFAASSLVVPATQVAESAPKRSKKSKKKKNRKKRRRKPQSKADLHFKNGVKLFDEQKYAEALAEFEQAFMLEPHPLVLYNLAGSHRALSQYAKAIDFYNRFLVEAVGKVSDDLLHRGRAEYDELLKLIARVDVTSTPEGADVTVDGDPVGQTPLQDQVILGPGDHRIEASLEGYKPVTRKIRVAAGDTLEVELELLTTSSESNSEKRVPAPELMQGPERRRISISAGVGTNALQADVTGTPSLGGAFAVTDRLSVGVEVLLTALSAIPELRYRVLGDKLSLHVVLAAPVNFQSGGESSVFAAGAGGMGVRYQATDLIALRLESWVSYAGKVRGTTVPSFAVGEVFF